MADWATISSLATAGGTLVLAGATFTAVRSSNRSARIAEQALQEQRRPVLVHARLDDMKKVRGIIVYPRRIEEIVRGHAGVDEFQIVFRRVDGLDDILVRIDPAPALSGAECQGLCRALEEGLRIGLGIRVTVEATEPGGLPRWDHKAKRVKDERTEVPF